MSGSSSVPSSESNDSLISFYSELLPESREDVDEDYICEHLREDNLRERSKDILAANEVLYSKLDSITNTQEQMRKLVGRLETRLNRISDFVTIKITKLEKKIYEIEKQNQTGTDLQQYTISSKKSSSLKKYGNVNDDKTNLYYKK